MKGMFKKALAGVAAAALAVTGLAVGASTASAASTDTASITVYNADSASTYMAYRFATFTDVQAGDSAGVAASVSVQTADGWSEAVTDAALSAWNSTNGEEDTDLNAVPSPYTSNPAAWVATWDTVGNAAALREFAAGLKAPQDVQGIELEYNAGSESASASVPEGWYLVVDSGEDTVNMIVATEITVGETTYSKLGDEQLGVAYAKTTTDTPPSKSSDKDEQGTVGIGDTIQFTITDEIPNWIGNGAYTYTITDVASKGLSITEGSFVVTVAGNNVTGSVNITSIVGQESGAPTTTIAFGDIVNKYNPGDKVVVTYKATVTADAVDSVTNTVSADHNGVSTGNGTPVSLHVGDFTFTKTDAQKQQLAGATFQIMDEQNNVLWFVQETDEEGNEINGAYRLATSSREDGATQNLTTAETNGVFNVRGLKKGVYTVVETKVPDGYYSSITGSFNVTIDDKGNATYNDEGLDSFDVVTIGENNSSASVMNVKSVSELPQTGAAGITLFVVLGLLIAGAGVTVWMKSRGVRNAING